MAKKGERTLDAEGKWMCKNGHDKDVEGATHRGCNKCANIRRLKWQQDKQKAKGTFKGEQKEIPNLRALRQEFGLSVRALARNSGADRVSITHVEKGRRKAGYTTQRKLINYFAPLIAKKKKYGYRK